MALSDRALPADRRVAVVEDLLGGKALADERGARVVRRRRRPRRRAARRSSTGSWSSRPPSASRRSPRSAARSRSTHEQIERLRVALNRATGKDVEVKVDRRPVGDGRHRRHDRRPRDRRLRPSSARATAKNRSDMPELTINADEIAAALRKHVDTFSPVARRRPRSAGCSRSVTASRASPGLPDDLGQRGARVRGRHPRSRPEPRRGLDRCGGARRGQPRRGGRRGQGRPAASSRCRSATR